MTAVDWLASHPYLQGVADLHAIVERASSSISPANPSALTLDDYRDDFLRGVPLLHSSAIVIDWTLVEKSIQAIVGDQASSFLPGKLTEQARTLCAELRADPGARRNIVAWLLLQEDLVLATPGLLRYLGWTAMSRYLHLVTDAFDRWRDEDQWLRSYCPTCGSLPAMLQLIGVDQGRRRLLADWTSIHLDVVACDRGLKRLAASLYELNLNF